MQDTRDSALHKPRRVALVLSGGGAKGAYEAGVIGGLEELGIHIDVVVGTPAGALNALVYSLSNSQHLTSLWSRIRKRDVLRLRWWWVVAVIVSLSFLVSTFDYSYDKVHELLKLLGLTSRATDRELSLLGLLLIFLITFPLIAQWVTHKVAIRSATIGTWLDSNFHILKSFYTNAPLVLMLRRELHCECCRKDYTTSQFTLRRPAQMVVICVRTLIFISSIALIVLGGRRNIVFGVWMLLGVLLISAYVTAVTTAKLKGLSQRCIKRLCRGIDGKGGQGQLQKELIITACDLDARCDTTFFLLRQDYEQQYCNRQARRAEVLLNIDIPDPVRKSGGYDYVNLRGWPQIFLSAVIASTSIPLVFPPQRLRLPKSGLWNGATHRFVDGGVGNNTPIKAAEDAGATHIIVVEVNPRNVDFAYTPLCTLTEIGTRTISAMLSSSIDEEYHRQTDLSSASKEPMNRPEIIVIKPQAELEVTGLGFGRRAQGMMDRGRYEAIGNTRLRALSTIPGGLREVI